VVGPGLGPRRGLFGRSSKHRPSAGVPRDRVVYLTSCETTPVSTINTARLYRGSADKIKIKRRSARVRTIGFKGGGPYWKGFPK